MRNQSIENGQEKSNKKTGKKNSLDKLSKMDMTLIHTSISDVADEDGWAFLGEVGRLIQKKRPNFDPRNYGFQKLTPLLASTKKLRLNNETTLKVDKINIYQDKRITLHSII